MSVTYNFDGQVALVTGAAKGIGRATAMAFAQAGAAVIVADIDHVQGKSAVQEIEDQSGQAAFVPADMTDEASIAALFFEIERKFGRLDFAHNNVGFGWGSQLLGSSLSDWNKTIALSLTAPFLCMQHEVRLMKQGPGGSIVNTASMAAIRYAEVASAPYTAAKAGVLALTRYAATAHSSDKIRVNAVSPGLVSTEAVARYMTGNQQIAFAARAQPIGRPVGVSEVAECVLWLCSDAAAMVTGENICVAGGQQAT